MFDLTAVQAALREQGFDGWLLYDFRGLNVLARRVLDLPTDAMLSRRWFYFVPAQGEPRKLVHRIEPHALDHLPGHRADATCAGRNWRPACRRWWPAPPRGHGIRAAQRQPLRLARRCRHRRAGPLLRRRGRVRPATWCSCSRPAGTTSSGPCTWRRPGTPARPSTSPSPSSPSACAAAAPCARPKCSSASSTTSPRTTWSPTIRPSVAVGPHSGDPHYAPGPGSDAPIREGDFVLIDLWAKLDRPRAVYSDLTWTGFVGQEVPGALRGDLPDRGPGPRRRHRPGRGRLSRPASRCRAGKWTRPPAT